MYRWLRHVLLLCVLSILAGVAFAAAPIQPAAPAPAAMPQVTPEPPPPCPVNSTYEQVWNTISSSFYKAETLGDWGSWRHRFDCDIHNDEDAYRYSAQMAAEAHDVFTFFVPPDYIQQRQGRSESQAPQVRTQPLPTPTPASSGGNGHSGRSRPSPVAYLRFENFEQLNTVEQVRDGMASVQYADAIVLDVRHNLGGWVDQSLAISGIFIERGLVIEIRERAGGDYADPQYQTVRWYLTEDALEKRRAEEDGSETVIESRGREVYQLRHRKLAILVDESTASAAELLVGALSQNPGERVTTFGTTSYGKGVGQLYYVFGDGTGVNVTALRYYTPRGEWYGDGENERHGIVPMVPAAATVDPSRFGTADDEPLRTANAMLLR